jgi:iron complex transport system substrate-binding protein
MMNRLLVILCSALLLSSCGRRTAAPQEEGDTVRFRHAQLLSVVRHEGYTVATIRHPWRQDAVLHRYVLVRADRPLPDPLPEGTLLRTPLSRSVVFTTVHCSLLQMLHRQEAVAGVADLKYIKAPYVHDGVRSGRIADCGDGMSPVIEKIIDLRPDALLLSPFENSGGYGRLEEIDIPIVECAEYMEPSPLGRAEWMRFYGMLYGCEREADSLWAVVDSSYQQLMSDVRRLKADANSQPSALSPQPSTLSPQPSALSSQPSALSPQPSCLVDKVTGSVWYVPGGHSTIGRMLSDAAADYPWADDEHSGSVSLPFEAVLERGGDCRVWLLRYSGREALTRRQLLSEHRGYQQFRAFREGRVYGCNVELSAFYEETPFRPDWLLTDFIAILHPEMLPNYTLRYYHPVR